MTDPVTFDIDFRDEKHFYDVVRWMETNVGHGKDKWTIDGRVLKHLKKGLTIVRTVRVFDPTFDKSNSLYLALI